MNIQLRHIRRLYNVIDNSLFTTTGQLDYGRITDGIIELANSVHNYDGDNDDLWSIGEMGICDLSDFIIGAYWHYTEWHAGQWSKGYEALSALGQVFSPGMSDPEPDNEAYASLNDMAEISRESA